MILIASKSHQNALEEVFVDLKVSPNGLLQLNALQAAQRKQSLNFQLATSIWQIFSLPALLLWSWSPRRAAKMPWFTFYYYPPHLQRWKGANTKSKSQFAPSLVMVMIWQWWGAASPAVSKALAHSEWVKAEEFSKSCFDPKNMICLILTHFQQIVTLEPYLRS